MLGIELLSRKEALQKYSKQIKRFTQWPGAHGKSTTSAILSSIIPNSQCSTLDAISTRFWFAMYDVHPNTGRLSLKPDDAVMDEFFSNSKPNFHALQLRMSAAGSIMGVL